jgi:poly-gamma-glutamate synthesis protein (capsule biosynthesis protein)
MAWGARREGADLVVVSIHCCTEYRSEPTSDQVELFEELIENPWVDLVVGHHSHVVGPVAEIDGEYVIYGLGNLVSGQTHRQDAREGVVAIVDAAWDGRRWRVTGVGAVPTFVEGRTYAIVPQAPGSPAAERTMSALGAYGVPVTQRLVEDINDPA